MKEFAILSCAGALFAAAILVSSAGAGASTDFTGKWAVTGSMPDEIISPTCTFKQDGGKLSGFCKGPSALGDLDGAADGDTIVWHWDRVATNDKVSDGTLTFRGKLGSDGAIRGEWKDSEVDDEVGNFVAQKLKP